MNRTLGFDLGSKTLGVSVSDPLGLIARALENTELVKVRWHG